MSVQPKGRSFTAHSGTKVAVLPEGGGGAAAAVSSSLSVFCPKAGPSLQAEKPRLQFCRRQVFHRKLRNQSCSFPRGLIGAIACRCFPHPTLSLASEQTLKDLKRSQGHQRGGEESGFGSLGPPDFTEVSS